MTPQLNFDCLNQIFKFVIEDNDSNPALLYSFSLVSKVWCQAAIPLLWSNPWKIHKTGVNLPLKRNIIIKTYFSCLYQELRDVLINESFFKELFLISCENSSSSQEMIKANKEDK